MEIRKIRPEEAEAYLAMQKQLDRETDYMLFEPGERTLTVEEVQKRLEKIEKIEHESIFIAEKEGKLVGHIEGHGGAAKRNRGCVRVVIGILQDYTRKGIGTELFKALEHWAKERHVHRLELTVMEHNRPAMMLYAKCGFHVEGMRKHALIVNDRYVNEFYMAKLLEKPRIESNSSVK
ncbi:MAG TPA: GNAT family N-acetyltransferase [Bacillales bacterium]|nr:GNAT family N-acetyltransferase [Bacillales bacterium]